MGKAGVLLLNATLTVRAHEAASHQGHGWETFTDAVIAHLAATREHLVFLLWALMPSRKVRLSTVRGILCSRRRIRRLCQPIEASSETIISRKPTPTCCNMVKHL